MVTHLPHGLQKLLEVTVGMPWPEGSEDDLWHLASAWDEFGGDLDAAATGLTARASGFAQALQGDTGSQLNRLLAAEMHDSAIALKEQAEAYSKMLRNAGADIQKTKIMIIGMLAILAATIASLLASLFGSFAVPSVIAAARVGIGALLRSLVSRLMEVGLVNIAKEIVLKAAIGGLVGAGFMVGFDSAIQGVQIAQGHRKGFDKEALKGDAIGGAIGGALGGAAEGLAGALGKIGRDIWERMPRSVRGFAPLGSTVLQIPAAAASNPVINKATHSPGNAIDGVFGALDPGSGAGHAKVKIPHMDMPDIKPIGTLTPFLPATTPTVSQGTPVVTGSGTPIGNAFTQPTPARTSTTPVAPVRQGEFNSGDQGSSQTGRTTPVTQVPTQGGSASGTGGTRSGRQPRQQTRTAVTETADGPSSPATGRTGDTTRPGTTTSGGGTQSSTTTKTGGGDKTQRPTTSAGGTGQGRTGKTTATAGGGRGGRTGDTTTGGGDSTQRSTTNAGGTGGTGGGQAGAATTKTTAGGRGGDTTTTGLGSGGGRAGGETQSSTTTASGGRRGTAETRAGDGTRPPAPTTSGGRTGGTTTTTNGGDSTQRSTTTAGGTGEGRTGDVAKPSTTTSHAGGGRSGDTTTTTTTGGTGGGRNGETQSSTTGGTGGGSGGGRSGGESQSSAAGGPGGSRSGDTASSSTGDSRTGKADAPAGGRAGDGTRSPAPTTGGGRTGDATRLSTTTPVTAGADSTATTTTGRGGDVTQSSTAGAGDRTGGPETQGGRTESRALSGNRGQEQTVSAGKSPESGTPSAATVSKPGEPQVTSREQGTGGRTTGDQAPAARGADGTTPAGGRKPAEGATPVDGTKSVEATKETGTTIPVVTVPQHDAPVRGSVEHGDQPKSQSTPNTAPTKPDQPASRPVTAIGEKRSAAERTPATQSEGVVEKLNPSEITEETPISLQDFLGARHEEPALVHEPEIVREDDGNRHWEEDYEEDASFADDFAAMTQRAFTPRRRAEMKPAWMTLDTIAEVDESHIEFIQSRPSLAELMGIARGVDEHGFSRSVLPSEVRAAPLMHGRTQIGVNFHTGKEKAHAQRWAQDSSSRKQTTYSQPEKFPSRKGAEAGPAPWREDSVFVAARGDADGFEVRLTDGSRIRLDGPNFARLVAGVGEFKRAVGDDPRGSLVVLADRTGDGPALDFGRTLAAEFGHRQPVVAPTSEVRLRSPLVGKGGQTVLNRGGKWRALPVAEVLADVGLRGRDDVTGQEVSFRSSQVWVHSMDKADGTPTGVSFHTGKHLAGDLATVGLAPSGDVVRLPEGSFDTAKAQRDGTIEFLPSPWPEKTYTVVTHGGRENFHLSTVDGRDLRVSGETFGRLLNDLRPFRDAMDHGGAEAVFLNVCFAGATDAPGGPAHDFQRTLATEFGQRQPVIASTNKVTFFTTGDNRTWGITLADGGTLRTFTGGTARLLGDDLHARRRTTFARDEVVSRARTRDGRTVGVDFADAAGRPDPATFADAARLDDGRYVVSTQDGRVVGVDADTFNKVVVASDAFAAAFMGAPRTSGKRFGLTGDHPQDWAGDSASTSGSRPQEPVTAGAWNADNAVGEISRVVMPAPGELSTLPGGIDESGRFRSIGADEVRVAPLLRGEKQIGVNFHTGKEKARAWRWAQDTSDGEEITYTHSDGPGRSNFPSREDAEASRSPWLKDSVFVAARGDADGFEVRLTDGSRVRLDGPNFARLAVRLKVFRNAVGREYQGSLVVLAARSGEVVGSGGAAHDFARTLAVEFNLRMPWVAPTADLHLRTSWWDRGGQIVFDRGGGWRVSRVAEVVEGVQLRGIDQATGGQAEFHSSDVWVHRMGQANPTPMGMVFQTGRELGHWLQWNSLEPSGLTQLFPEGVDDPAGIVEAVDAGNFQVVPSPWPANSYLVTTHGAPTAVLVTTVEGRRLAVTGETFGRLLRDLRPFRDAMEPGGAEALVLQVCWAAAKDGPGGVGHDLQRTLASEFGYRQPVVASTTMAAITNSQEMGLADAEPRWGIGVLSGGQWRTFGSDPARLPDAAGSLTSVARDEVVAVPVDTVESRVFGERHVVAGAAAASGWRALKKGLTSVQPVRALKNLLGLGTTARGLDQQAGRADTAVRPDGLPGGLDESGRFRSIGADEVRVAPLMHGSKQIGVNFHTGKEKAHAQRWADDSSSAKETTYAHSAGRSDFPSRKDAEASRSPWLKDSVFVAARGDADGFQVRLTDGSRVRLDGPNFARVLAGLDEFKNATGDNPTGSLVLLADRTGEAAGSGAAHDFGRTLAAEFGHRQPIVAPTSEVHLRSPLVGKGGQTVLNSGGKWRALPVAEVVADVTLRGTDEETRHQVRFRSSEVWVHSMDKADGTSAGVSFHTGKHLRDDLEMITKAHSSRSILFPAGVDGPNRAAAFKQGNYQEVRSPLPENAYTVTTHGHRSFVVVTTVDGRNLKITGETFSRLVNDLRPFRDAMERGRSDAVFLNVCWAAATAGPGGIAHDFQRNLAAEFGHHQPVVAGTNRMAYADLAGRQALSISDGGQWRTFGADLESVPSAVRTAKHWATGLFRGRTKVRENVELQGTLNGEPITFRSSEVRVGRLRRSGATIGATFHNARESLGRKARYAYPESESTRYYPRDVEDMEDARAARAAGRFELARKPWPANSYFIGTHGNTDSFTVNLRRGDKAVLVDGRTFARLLYDLPVFHRALDRRGPGALVLGVCLVGAVDAAGGAARDFQHALAEFGVRPPVVAATTKVHVSVEPRRGESMLNVGAGGRWKTFQSGPAGLLAVDSASGATVHLHPEQIRSTPLVRDGLPVGISFRDGTKAGDLANWAASGARFVDDVPWQGSTFFVDAEQAPGSRFAVRDNAGRRLLVDGGALAKVMADSRAFRMASAEGGMPDAVAWLASESAAGPDGLRAGDDFIRVLARDFDFQGPVFAPTGWTAVLPAVAELPAQFMAAKDMRWETYRHEWALPENPGDEPRRFMTGDVRPRPIVLDGQLAGMSFRAEQKPLEIPVSASAGRVFHIDASANSTKFWVGDAERGTSYTVSTAQFAKMVAEAEPFKAALRDTELSYLVLTDGRTGEESGHGISSASEFQRALADLTGRFLPIVVGDRTTRWRIIGGRADQFVGTVQPAGAHVFVADDVLVSPVRADGKTVGVSYQGELPGGLREMPRPDMLPVVAGNSEHWQIDAHLRDGRKVSLPTHEFATLLADSEVFAQALVNRPRSVVLLTSDPGLVSRWDDNYQRALDARFGNEAPVFMPGAQKLDDYLVDDVRPAAVDQSIMERPDDVEPDLVGAIGAAFPTAERGAVVRPGKWTSLPRPIASLFGKHEQRLSGLDSVTGAERSFRARDVEMRPLHSDGSRVGMSFRSGVDGVELPVISERGPVFHVDVDASETRFGLRLSDGTALTVDGKTFADVVAKARPFRSTTAKAELAGIALPESRAGARARVSGAAYDFQRALSELGRKETVVATDGAGGWRAFGGEPGSVVGTTLTGAQRLLATGDVRVKAVLDGEKTVGMSYRNGPVDDLAALPSDTLPVAVTGEKNRFELILHDGSRVTVTGDAFAEVVATTHLFEQTRGERPAAIALLGSRPGEHDVDGGPAHDFQRALARRLGTEVPVVAKRELGTEWRTFAPAEPAQLHAKTQQGELVPLNPDEVRLTPLVKDSEIIGVVFDADDTELANDLKWAGGDGKDKTYLLPAGYHARRTAEEADVHPEATPASWPDNSFFVVSHGVGETFQITLKDGGLRNVTGSVFADLVRRSEPFRGRFGGDDRPAAVALLSCFASDVDRPGGSGFDFQQTLATNFGHRQPVVAPTKITTVSPDEYTTRVESYINVLDGGVWRTFANGPADVLGRDGAGRVLAFHPADVRTRPLLDGGKPVGATFRTAGGPEWTDGTGPARWPSGSAGVGVDAVGERFRLTLADGRAVTVDGRGLAAVVAASPLLRAAEDGRRPLMVLADAADYTAVRDFQSALATATGRDDVVVVPGSGDWKVTASGPTPLVGLEIAEQRMRLFEADEVELRTHSDDGRTLAMSYRATEDPATVTRAADDELAISVDTDARQFRLTLADGSALEVSGVTFAEVVGRSKQLGSLVPGVGPSRFTLAGGPAGELDGPGGSAHDFQLALQERFQQWQPVDARTAQGDTRTFATVPTPLVGTDIADVRHVFQVKNVRFAPLLKDGRTVGMTLRVGFERAEAEGWAAAASGRDVTQLLDAGGYDHETAVEAGALRTERAPWSDGTFFIDAEGSYGSARVYAAGAGVLNLDGDVFAKVVTELEPFRQALGEGAPESFTLLVSGIGSAWGTAPDFQRTLAEEFGHEQPVHAPTNDLQLGVSEDDGQAITAVVDGGRWRSFPVAEGEFTNAATELREQFGRVIDGDARSDLSGASFRSNTDRGLESPRSFDADADHTANFDFRAWLSGGEVSPRYSDFGDGSPIGSPRLPALAELMNLDSDGTGGTSTSTSSEARVHWMRRSTQVAGVSFNRDDELPRDPVVDMREYS